MKRIALSVPMREEFEETTTAPTPEHPTRGFVQQAATLRLQTAIEEAVKDFLGREHYPRGLRTHSGWRNGYERVTVKSEAAHLGSRERAVDAGQDRLGDHLAA